MDLKDLMGRLARQHTGADRSADPGPVAWHPMCSRFHPRGQICDLSLRERTAKSGRKVDRWAH